MAQTSRSWISAGSIFGRFADIRLSDCPLLEWCWRVDRPLQTELDERTREGDDHAARRIRISADLSVRIL